MTIKVRSSYDFGTAISVTVDDFCNHAGAEEEQLEFTAYSSYDGGAYTAPDDSTTESVMVCQKCRAWQDLDETWRSEDE